MVVFESNVDCDSTSDGDGPLPKTRTTTLRLPLPLYQQLKSMVEKQRGGPSLNDLMVTAIRGYVKACRRKQIDAAFAGMAQDPGYQREAQQISEDFAVSDWEALR